MRGISIILIVGCWLLAALQPAWSADAEITPTSLPTAPNPATSLPTAPKLYTAGSLSAFRNDNALQSPSDRRLDNYVNVDLTLGLMGTLPADWTYKIYGRGFLDRFERVRDGDDSVSLVGGSIGHNLADWKMALSYEYRQYYLGIFGPLDFVTNDVKIGASRDLPLGPLLTTPHLSLLYRKASNSDVDQVLLDMSIDLELPINKTWSIVSTPQFRQYWYLAGANQARRDSKYTSSLGLKYNFNERVSLSTAVRYEIRTSNFAGKDYHSFEFGPELDFSF
jgi:hypothetical protein